MPIGPDLGVLASIARLFLNLYARIKGDKPLGLRFELHDKGDHAFVVELLVVNPNSFTMHARSVGWSRRDGTGGHLFPNLDNRPVPGRGNVRAGKWNCAPYRDTVLIENTKNLLVADSIWVEDGQFKKHEMPRAAMQKFQTELSEAMSRPRPGPPPPAPIRRIKLISRLE